jgi:seryl-tRNA synthetase
MTDDIILNPADQAAKTPIPPVVDAGDDEPADQVQKTYTHEEHEKAIQKRVKKLAKENEAFKSKIADYDAIKADADEFRKLKDSQKTEVQRLADEKKAEEGKRLEAERNLEALKVDLLRQRLCAKSQLPSEWWEDVKGGTEAEIKESIITLSKKLKLDKQRVGGPTPQSGAREVKTNANVNDALFRFVGVGGR